MRIHRSVTLLAALALLSTQLVSCSKKQPEPAAGTSELLTRVREAVIAREKKLESYQFGGTTQRGKEKAEFKFSFRAPNKMRAELLSANKVFFFDGKRLLEWDATQEKMTEFDVESAPKEKRALLLHKVFSPFVPEGWRAPLLAGELKAEERRQGEDVIAAVTSTTREGDESYEITWLFKLPAMTYVGKEVKGGGEVKVLEQHCEPSLDVCLPSKIEEQVPGEPVMRTELKDIKVNIPLPPEYFEIRPAEGIAYEKRAIE